ncbi:MAG TPA: hypothetical protein VK832_18715, partial [Burkholderiaceae bacterium]|nr:hypothetical protein [Burkholderiaceae bacterium]
WIDYMRVALKGMPISQRAEPSGVVQSEGDWMYNEFVDQGAVKTLGMDDASAPADNSGNPLPAVSPPDPNAMPARPFNPPPPPTASPPANDQERQKAIDMFKNG